MAQRGFFGRAFLDGGDVLSMLAAQGQVFYASDADQNDTITGQTSFADTTPTFLLRVPAGTTAIPLMISLTQTGTVAGGAISMLMEIDNADRYASGGTAETILSSRTVGGESPLCSLYSNPTASSGYGVRIDAQQVGADVDTAEGAPNRVRWTPEAGLDFLVGPSSWLVYTYAGTTGPTWDWTFKWAEFPTTEL